MAAERLLTKPGLPIFLGSRSRIWIASVSLLTEVELRSRDCQRKSSKQEARGTEERVVQLLPYLGSVARSMRNYAASQPSDIGAVAKEIVCRKTMQIRPCLDANLLAVLIQRTLRHAVATECMQGPWRPERG
jgi:hypothetical protein